MSDDADDDVPAWLEYAFVGGVVVVIGAMVGFLAYVVGSFTVVTLGVASLPPGARLGTDRPVTWAVFRATWWLVPTGVAAVVGGVAGLAGVGYITLGWLDRLAAWYAHLTGSEPE